MDIEEIRKKFRKREYVVAFTHTEKLRRRRIGIDSLEEAVASGEVIESYPDALRGEACLVLGHSEDGRPLHLVLGNFEGREILVITAYEPDSERWERDWRTRKKGEN